MSTKKLVKRFDRYSWQNNSQEKKELRKYIEEIFEIKKAVSNAFVPSVFVLQSKKSSLYVTNSTWVMNIRTIFPPTDFITLGLIDERNFKKITFFGWTETKSLIKVLSPHIHELDSYSFLKKLHADYKYNEEIEQLIKIGIKPDPIPKDETILVDEIPSFEEEMIYLLNLSQSGIPKKSCAFFSGHPLKDKGGN